MTKSVISLGLIGLSDFENDPLLQAITVQNRFQLNAAYSPCFQKLANFSQQLKVTTFASFRQLAASDQVQGLIWNQDAIELRPEQLELGCAAQHLLVRSEVLQSLPVSRLINLQNHAVETQTEIFPELLHRWTPSTLRLRELIATQLGPVQKIHVKNVSSGGDFSTLFQVVDWLRMLLSLRSLSVQASQVNSLVLEFERLHAKNVACVIELNQLPPTETDQPSVLIDCEAGQVELISAVKLLWRTDCSKQEESFAGERSAEEVLLDLFGRRIAGGIVPVPDLMEVFRTQRVLNAIEASRLSGGLVHIDDNSLPIDDGEICF